MPSFHVRVPFDPGGYRWVRRAPKVLNSDPATCLCIEGAGYAEMRRRLKKNSSTSVATYAFLTQYDPSAKEPALFRVFAELDGSETAVLEFANRYGDIAEVPNILMPEFPFSLADWRKQITKIRKAIETADTLIRNKASITEIFAFTKELLKHMAVNVTLQPSGNGIGLEVSGVGLLDAIKLQLADAVTERKGFRNCEFCGRPFELRPQVNRADRLFCSDTCRVKAYKRRKKEAVVLRQKGLTMREIAKQTSSEMATLKKWFEDLKPKET